MRTAVLAGGGMGQNRRGGRGGGTRVLETADGGGPGLGKRATGSIASKSGPAKAIWRGDPRPASSNSG